MCLFRQMYHLLGQLASFPRKTSSTGFLFLLFGLLGWGKRLSLGLDPPLPSLGSPTVGRTNRAGSYVARLAVPGVRGPGCAAGRGEGAGRARGGRSAAR